jgi:hypothetical protein
MTERPGQQPRMNRAPRLPDRRHSPTASSRARPAGTDDTSFGSALPPFYCPISPDLHPAAHALGQQALIWLESIGLCESPELRAAAKAVRVGEFWGRAMPRTPGTAGLQLGADWNLWGFRFDDLRSEATSSRHGLPTFVQLVNHLQQAVEAPPTSQRSSDCHVRAIQDLNRRLRDLAGQVVVRRWEEAHRRWLMAETWQASLRSQAALPDLNDHTAIRIATSGGQILEVIMEVAENAEMTTRERETPEVRALSDAACAIAGFDNDIFSLRKESHGTHPTQNLIPVLQKENGYSLHEAVARAVQLRNQIMVLFAELCRQVRPTASGPLGRYLDNIGHMIRGNLDWSLTTPRYTLGDNPVTVTYTEDPTGISHTAPPIPAIAWWWSLLKPA